MANGHGGSRTPSNPAMVSGPGKFSARTDGQVAQYVSDMPYGEGQQFMDLQRQAPMAAAQGSTPVSSAPSSAPSAPLVPMGAPTQMPDQPVTAGAPFGPGPGSEVLPPQIDRYASLRKQMPTLLKLADLPTTSDATRNVIRYLRGVL